MSTVNGRVKKLYIIEENTRDRVFVTTIRLLGHHQVGLNCLTKYNLKCHFGALNRGHCSPAVCKPYFLSCFPHF